MTRDSVRPLKTSFFFLLNWEYDLYSTLAPRKINIPLLCVCADQLDPQLVSNIHSLLSSAQQTFHMRLQHANKCPAWRHSGNNGIKASAHPLAHVDCGNPLPHPPSTLPSP